MRLFRVVILGSCCAGLLGFATFVYQARAGGRVLARAVSPDGMIVAEWRRYPWEFMSDDSEVTLRNAHGWSRHPVMSAMYVREPRLIWLDKKTVQVNCANCGAFDPKCLFPECKQGIEVEWAERGWHDITIVYGYDHSSR